ncbi:CaiB/BaiF CoA transferase family protein [Stenotrophobium rhamnosiphilum]|uniref:CoA transferase n=1 Tax=Stenotrophobium rhamnosiphilum TaxID=2029166 RepID=A0A2T5MH54_9GAMM|nr:CaiB/BaiF CoA-transferase family protein [Stenotrophobium rhamnosiphilum]PTU31869.1 CoA transferase [Stenotrophobium rhamnosiphilum]
MRPPLSGVNIVEFEGLGPGPLAGLMLAGMGANVTVIARPQRGAVNAQLGGDGEDPIRRGKKILTIDLKQAGGVQQAMDLVATADALIEGNRPGVMERLGLGPADCAVRNPKLVYGRMTGWGQTGPLAMAAGHDLNYVALSGLLSLSGRPGERPIIPPTIVGDASGALGLAFGIVCALLDARASGKGRVVDAAIVDVLAMLSGLALFARAGGQLDGEELSPFYDSPFYDVYKCADGESITIAAMEPQFYRLLLDKLNLSDVDPAAQYDKSTWPALKARITDIFSKKPRAHWDALIEGSDVCYSPVLSIAEATQHPHNIARGNYTVSANGEVQAASAPRFFPLNVNSVA